MNSPRRRFLAFALVGALCPAAAPAQVQAATPFSHADWTSVLQRFVDDRGRVDYVGLVEDRRVFDRYVESIAHISPLSNPEFFPTRNHELAYYINAYNALVIKGVLARGPESESVWRGVISGYAFFVQMAVTFGGKRTNLKKLENDHVLRFDDPRVHAALNCASVGCPRLPRQAFEPETLDESLDDAMREFVGEDRNCRIDDATRTVHLSRIFDWFASDFVGKMGGRELEEALIGYVNGYRDPEAVIPSDYSVKFPEYDKRINKQ